MKKVFLFAASVMMFAACNCGNGSNNNCSDDDCRGARGENCREICDGDRDCDKDFTDSCDDCDRNRSRHHVRHHRSGCDRRDDCRTNCDDNCADGTERCAENNECRTEHCR